MIRRKLNWFDEFLILFLRLIGILAVITIVEIVVAQNLTGRIQQTILNGGYIALTVFKLLLIVFMAVKFLIKIDQRRKQNNYE